VTVLSFESELETVQKKLIECENSLIKREREKSDFEARINELKTHYELHISNANSEYEAKLKEQLRNSKAQISKIRAENKVSLNDAKCDYEAKLKEHLRNSEAEISQIRAENKLSVNDAECDDYEAGNGL